MGAVLYIDRYNPFNHFCEYDTGKLVEISQIFVCPDCFPPPPFFFFLLLNRVYEVLRLIYGRASYRFVRNRVMDKLFQAQPRSREFLYFIRLIHETLSIFNLRMWSERFVARERDLSYNAIMVVSCSPRNGPSSELIPRRISYN